MKEMACEVFKIVTQIAPTIIQNLIIFKCSQYSLRKDQTPAVPKANTSKSGLKIPSWIMDPGSGTVYQMNYEKCKKCQLRRIPQTDPKLGWSTANMPNGMANLNNMYKYLLHVVYMHAFIWCYSFYLYIIRFNALILVFFWHLRF